MSSGRAADAVDDADGLEAARRRHPCMRSPVRPAELQGRIAAAIGQRGACHPEVAASVLAVRGAAGLAPEPFARRAGVDVDLLRRAEAGELARDELPGALRRMVPQGAGPQKFSSL
jgi:hypothetical protein